MKIPAFEVLTKKSVMDLIETEDKEMLYKEQNKHFKAMFEN